MSRILDEQLSAFLDGELPPEEVDLLLARLDRDPARRATLGRYAMIGECIRTGAAAPAALEVADRVRCALAADASATPVAVAARGSRMGWVGGAVAASLAVVALLLTAPGIWQDATPLRSAQPEAALLAARDDAGLEPLTDVNAIASHRLGPRAAARLTSYLMAHGEYANAISRSNFDSRLVSARAERASWRQAEEAADAR